MAGVVRIGISGWRYAPWRGVFYPKGLAQRCELEYAAREFGTIEINGSFYSLQRASSWQAWHDAVPRDFVFAVKGPRFITHIKRLREIDAPLANFFASGVLLLERKLGPVLWQFPPNFRFDAGLFDAFLRRLPRTQSAAAALARKHDRRIAASALPARVARRRLRHALEVRHESFRSEEFVSLLRRRRVGLVVADAAGKYPLLEDLTADFVYIRLHGAQVLYRSGYDAATLADWARRLRAWAHGGEPRGARRIGGAAARRSGRDVYCYFDNDAKVKAPFDARSLRVALARRGVRAR